MQKRYFIVSGILHLLGFISLDRLSLHTPETKIVQIEYQGHHDVGNASSHSLRKSKAQKRNSTRMNLGLSTHQAIMNSRPAGETEQSNGASWDLAQSYNENALDQFEGLEIKDVRFVKSLWREIDKSVVNSHYLAEYSRFGKVFLSFEVEPNGRLNEQSFKVQAQDKVLKVIAARAIRKALRNEHGELSLPSKTVRINTQFAWDGYQNCSQLRGHQKYNLSFCYFSGDQRKSFSSSEKAATYLSALKYGFGAIEEIKKYKREEMHRKTQFNPFEEYERDPDWNLGG